MGKATTTAVTYEAEAIRNAREYAGDAARRVKELEAQLAALQRDASQETSADDLVKRLYAAVAQLDARDVTVISGSEIKSILSRLEAQAAEIARLRAALATARREGMEEAATIASQRRALNNQAQALREGAHDKKGAAEASIEAHEAAEIAAAIRAAAKEGKP